MNAAEPFDGSTATPAEIAARRNWRAETYRRQEIGRSALSPLILDTARMIPDPEHSEDEERFVLLGLSISVRVLVICHCYRQRGDVILITSVRKADSDEIEQYHWWQR